ncbi:C2H2 transcription factor (Sfp1) [Cordyceps militaris]|uniref:C2H2 transcription factor (Sfp1) n=1 Tax=Cordyceps militaris TaxID=73501 RepID=A0A2H4S7U7_CORMI|nr:C2H2 transcription factor (Sfp1) [Cordyceps militaris]
MARANKQPTCTATQSDPFAGAWCKSMSQRKQATYLLSAAYLCMSLIEPCEVSIYAKPISSLATQPPPSVDAGKSSRIARASRTIVQQGEWTSSVPSYRTPQTLLLLHAYSINSPECGRIDEVADS